MNIVLRTLAGLVAEPASATGPTNGGAGERTSEAGVPADAFAALLSAALAPAGPLPQPVALPAPAEGVADGETEPDSDEVAERADVSVSLVPAGSAVVGAEPAGPATSAAGVLGTPTVATLAASVPNMPGVRPTLATTATPATKSNPQTAGAATVAEAGTSFAASGPTSAAPAAGEPTGDDGNAPTPAERSDPRRVHRGLDQLNPEFRTRLQRVITRMGEEFGHRVEVVETVRTQARQDLLFAQGRTQPGPVVTWTRDSNHLKGRAADVLIDGTYNNSAGYAHFAQIAREEGLRTLGARDPGHVELPANLGTDALPPLAAATGEGAPPRATATREGALPRASEAASRREPLAPVAPHHHTADRVAEVARVAPVAQVAQVASVAVPRVARVATPAAPGGRGSMPRAADPGTRYVSVDPAFSREPVESEATPAAQTIAATEPGRAADKGRRGEADARRQGGEGSSTEVVASASAHRDGEARPHLSGAPTHSTASATGAQAVVASSGAEAADRLGRILELQQSAAARPLSHVLVRLDTPGGGEDRIRVDLRGGSVGTTIDLSDAASADHLNARVGELQHALERHGLEPESVRIRSVSTPTDAVAEVGRTLAAAAEADALRSGSTSRGHTDSHPHRERSAPPTPERDPESRNPRDRSRREHKGETPK